MARQARVMQGRVPPGVSLAPCEGRLVGPGGSWRGGALLLRTWEMRMVSSTTRSSIGGFFAAKRMVVVMVVVDEEKQGRMAAREVSRRLVQAATREETRAITGDVSGLYELNVTGACRRRK